ncbi:pyridoxal phosphate-dependent aminotransferase [Amphiplicatus metriothermophilus]|uniref:Aspartate/methionine/tyrosine aminotransferase n=1 Tax=Amphiplicatus metriothermophilus TaxID=1519374 RepID=A0A239PUZ2_9PROT|nr:pyridoxal phosphate-dependent aminotransferase [Amphiplicatus metriothermophilus]MBB5519560.1 aspartate/methionine/tyrosine aminotransferase [Amphiplicatus metriothermophilus]SNT74124.1 Aspartate/methionine/tyrosine aminotransferase [Amphiplicatus metriothermophilus]
MANDHTYAQWVRAATRRLTEAEGEEIISLFDSSVAEPVELVRRLIEENFRPPITTRYASVFSECNPFVIDALAARYDVSPENILCTTGATNAITLLYRTFLPSGGHVVVERPGFDIFADMAEAQGASVDFFDRPAPDFALDPERVAAAITPATRLIVLSNLHNPSGALAHDDALHAIAKIAAARGAMVVVDEVYRDYAGVEARKRPAAKLHACVLSISSLTKVFGLSTLRCGWIIAAPETLQPVRAFSERFEFNASKLAHAVAALTLEHGALFDRYAENIIAAARPVMRRRFDALVSAGLLAGRLPDYGCICFPRVVGVDDTRRLSDWLAGEYGVIVVPGECFSAPGHVRIGFALEPEILDAALTRLGQGLEARRRAGSTRALAG